MPKHYDDRWVRIISELCGICIFEGLGIIDIKNGDFIRKLENLHYTNKENIKLLHLFIEIRLECELDPENTEVINPVPDSLIKNMIGEEVAQRCTIYINKKTEQYYMEFFLLGNKIHRHNLNPEYPLLSFAENSSSVIKTLLTANKDGTIKKTSIYGLCERVNADLKKMSKALLTNIYLIYSRCILYWTRDGNECPFTWIPVEMILRIVEYMTYDLRVMNRKYKRKQKKKVK